MNLQEADILQTILHEPFINQRILAENSGHSIGVVNRSLHQLMKEGYLTENMQLTTKANKKIELCSPCNAIILAAGMGMRMIPVNFFAPKALIEVKGEKLIDRLIVQLHEAGIKDITVVVGFMKECFEYLIDEYEVNLVYNSDYATANNLHSLSLVADRIHNTYILPCDIWCEFNPFSKTELYSWYMVSDLMKVESNIHVNRKMELVSIPDSVAGNSMIGICYLLEAEASNVRENLKTYDGNDKYIAEFWESALFKEKRMIVQAKVVKSTDIIEINTFEQLRDIDSDSSSLKLDAIKVITSTLGCHEDEITNISVLKKGMTNRSFLFSVNDIKYIMRIPGEGTDQLINREQEAEVFRTINGLGLCDEPIYINSTNGYKITKYLEGVRVCNTENISDLKRCMEKLRTFHSMKLHVNHTFDIFSQIDFYEKLRKGNFSLYRDYKETKEKVFSLRFFIDSLQKDWCLTHIDAVPDNFLFFIPEGKHEEQLQLIDWEYSGMQDPHVDVAMFCIYSLYNRQQCDQLIDLYFENECDLSTRAKIYCYIAAGGLLWSNWCEYKFKLGVEFGEYSLRQYRYAKEYYKYAKELINFIEKGDKLDDR